MTACCESEKSFFCGLDAVGRVRSLGSLMHPDTNLTFFPAVRPSKVLRRQSTHVSLSPIQHVRRQFVTIAWVLPLSLSPLKYTAATLPSAAPYLLTKAMGSDNGLLCLMIPLAAAPGGKTACRYCIFLRAQIDSERERLVFALGERHCSVATTIFCEGICIHLDLVLRQYHLDNTSSFAILISVSI